MDRLPCTSCRRPWAEDDFYEKCSECKVCKRRRSKQHRAAQARKIAAFERFVDVLVVLTANASHDEVGRDPSGV